MKVFIILTTYLAITLASGNHKQYPVAHEDIRYDGRFGYANLKIGRDGVPIDTPEVQHARAAHLSLVAKAIQDHAEWVSKHQDKSSNGQWVDNNEDRSSHATWDGNNQAKSSQVPWTGHDGSNGKPSGWSNLNSHNDGRYEYAQLKIGPNGVPIDTSEVQQAKDAHFFAHSKAKTSHAGWNGDNGAYGGQYGSSNLNYLNPQNNLKVAHLNTYSQDTVPQSDLVHQRHRRGISEDHSIRGHQEEQIHYSYAEIGPNGLPLDTPEVQALKQAHLAAHSAALALIEKHRKSPIWTNDQYDNGAWKDDTNAWADVETSTTKVWNTEGRRNKEYSNRKEWNNQGYDSNELKNVQAATSYMNQNLESGPHTKISVKSKGWSNASNNNGWNNEAYDNNEWKNTQPATSHSNQNLESGPQTKISVKSKGWSNVSNNNGWNNEAYNNDNGWSSEAYNNNAWNSGAGNNNEPATSHNNQRLESGPHRKVTWQNNPWNDEDNNAWKIIESTTAHNNQNLNSYEYSGNGWNNSGSTTKYGAYKGPHHVPKIHNGVPEYTPEVQLAREQHLAALAEALERASAYKNQQQEYHH